jgi:cytochrome c553
MKWNVRIAASALAVIAGSSYAQTMDPLQLRSLAASCSNCHGTLGVAEAGNESLAGANKDEMLKKMLDFKTGKKPATIMHQLSKGYTDEQLAALAGYFSSLKK